MLQNICEQKYIHHSCIFFTKIIKCTCPTIILPYIVGILHFTLVGSYLTGDLLSIRKLFACRESEQGNVFGLISVYIYIYMCVCTKKIVIE